MAKLKNYLVIFAFMLSNSKKIIVTDKVHYSLSERLNKYGFTTVTKEGITRNELIEILPEFEGIILRSRIIFDKELVERGINLRFIARAGSGMENIDTACAESKGIVCINSPEGNRDSVGELALGLVLSLLHNINKSAIETKNGKWNRKINRGNELKNKIIGIIGYGNTGSAFAKKIQGLDVEILAYDKYKTGFTDKYVKEVEMSEIFKYADIVSLHIPLNEETKYLANNNFFNSFYKTIIFINTSRGPIVNTAALADAIKTGKVKAAGLDVLEYENTAFESLSIDNDIYDFLCKNDNVIITPHIAGLSYESEERHAEILAEKIIKLYDSSQIENRKQM